MKIIENLKTEVKRFIMELDIAFDNISDDKKKELRAFSKSLNDKEFCEKWIETEYNNLIKISDPLKDNIKLIKENKKLNKNGFDFFSTSSLFNDILNLELFNSESKNTKKDICKVMYTIYKMLDIMAKGKENELSETQMNEIYEKYILSSTPEPVLPPALVKKDKNKQREEPKNELNNLMQDMMKEFQSGELNPMELLQEIMTKGPGSMTQEGTKMHKFSQKFNDRITDKNLTKQLEEQFGGLHF